MPEYRIYYADGSTFDADPFDAPFFGVLAIVERDPDHGRRVISNGDYYVWEGRWRNVDFIGMVDYLQMPGAKKVIAGRLVHNDEWNEIFRRARNDPDFPEQLATGVFEATAR